MRVGDSGLNFWSEYALKRAEKGIKMRVAKIYQPVKTAMQSGGRKSKDWILEYPRQNRVGPDPLMGWQSSTGTRHQIKLTFVSQQAAIDYCEAHNISYEVKETRLKKPKIKAYADNFTFNRVDSWTH